MSILYHVNPYSLAPAIPDCWDVDGQADAAENWCDVEVGNYTTGTVTTNGPGWSVVPGDWLVSLDSMGVIAHEPWLDYDLGTVTDNTLNLGRWSGAHNWRVTADSLGVIVRENFSDYSVGAVSDNTLNGGIGAWGGNWRIEADAFGVIAEEDFESYNVGDDLTDVLNGGTGWSAAWEPQSGTEELAPSLSKLIAVDNMRDGWADSTTGGPVKVASWRGDYWDSSSDDLESGWVFRWWAPLGPPTDDSGLDEDFEPGVWSFTGSGVVQWPSVDTSNVVRPIAWRDLTTLTLSHNVNLINDGSIYTDHFPAEGGYIQLVGDGSGQTTGIFQSAAILVDHLSWDLEIRAAGSQDNAGDASHTVTVKVWVDEVLDIATIIGTTPVLSSSFARAWNDGISASTFAVAPSRAGWMVIQLACTSSTANNGPLICGIKMTKT